MVTALGKAGKIGVQKTIFPALPSAVTMSLGKEIKKNFKLCRVPDRGHSAKIFFKKKIQTLSSAGQRALGKEIKKKFKLCRVPDRGHSAKKFKKNSNFAECRTEGTRQRNLKKIQTLPSARQRALGKEI